jgi:hypothetical protein
MAERLYESSMKFSRGRTVKYKALDVLALGAERLSGDTLQKFNNSEAESYMDDDAIDNPPSFEEEPNYEVFGFFDMSDSE